MVSYQIHAHVRHEIYETYITWLREEHIPEMLGVPGFKKADLLYRKGGAMESSGKEVKIIYSIENEEALKSYLAGPALKIREKGTDKFPGQFSIHREVWLESVSF